MNRNDIPYAIRSGLEKVSDHDFRAESAQALAEYRKKRYDEAQAKGGLSPALLKIREGVHEHALSWMAGPHTGNMGDIASADSLGSRVMLGVAGLRGGDQMAPIVNLHELDEAKSSNPDSVAGEDFRAMLRKQIGMSGSPGVTIGSHVGPYVLMNENNRILQARGNDPKTYASMVKARKERSLFGLIHNSQSDHLQKLVSALPEYGNREYTEEEIEAANNAMANSKIGKRIVAGYDPTKKYNPKPGMVAGEALAVAAPVLLATSAALHIIDAIKMSRL